MMSEKKKKAERRTIREITRIMAPLRPIYQAAYDELGGDMQLFMKWSTVALGVHSLCQEVSLSRLLPHVLDQTIDDMKDLLASQLERRREGAEQAPATVERQ